MWCWVSAFKAPFVSAYHRQVPFQLGEYPLSSVIAFLAKRVISYAKVNVILDQVNDLEGTLD